METHKNKQGKDKIVSFITMKPAIARIVLLISITAITIFFMTACSSTDEENIDIPGIELVGNIVMEIEQYSDFVDPGAAILGDFNIDVITDSNVNTNALGDYIITYTITYGSEEYVVSRTVRVVEQLSGDTPGLRFVGESTMEIEQYDNFIDPGVEIIGEFGLDIEVNSNVDVNTIGTYEIVYTITYMDVDYNLTRYVEVVAADAGSSIVVTEDYSSVTHNYLGYEFSYDTSGYSGIHMWAELYKDGEYIKTEILYEYTDIDFYDLDPETDYVVNVYLNYTTTSDYVEHYKTELIVYEFTTKAAPIVPVVENMNITSTSESITVEFDLIDAGGIMNSAYIYIVEGWSNAASAEIFVGHNLITFDEYIGENTFYEIVISANYTFNDDPAIYEGEVYTPPVITLDSFEQTNMFFAGEDLVMKLELDNDEDYDIDYVVINGTRYSTFDFPSDNKVIYVNLGGKSSMTYPINLHSVIISYDEVEYEIEVLSNKSVTVYEVGSIDPPDATIVVLEVVPESYFIVVDNNEPLAVTDLVVDVYLENDYFLPITSITIGGDTFTGTEIERVTATHIRITAEIDYASNWWRHNLSISELIVERNGEPVTVHSSPHTLVSVSKIYDFDYIQHMAEEDPDPTLDVVHISTPEELLGVESDPLNPARVFVLDNDIDMAGYNFIPIGTFENPFTGGFDGNGFTISNVTINRTFGAGHESNAVGLFGYSGARVTDLNIYNMNITITTTEDNYLYVGALAGRSGTAIDVHVYNSSITIEGIIKGSIGGLVGDTYQYSAPDLIRTSADTNIIIINYSDSSSDYPLQVGGLAGAKQQGDIVSSKATGDISVAINYSQTVYVGGLIGAGGEYVANSYATGNIITTGYGYSRVGGLVGINYGDTYVINCYATGNVQSVWGRIGGLIGETDGYVWSSFAIGTITTDGGSAGKIFGDGQQYNLDHMYVYDAQLVYRDLTTEYNGADSLYIYLGIASATEFNDEDYYTEFLNWNHHFFDFTNLDIENGDLPIFRTD